MSNRVIRAQRIGKDVHSPPYTDENHGKTSVQPVSRPRFEPKYAILMTSPSRSEVMRYNASLVHFVVLVCKLTTLTLP